jgi:hypothetical protein
MSEMSKAQGPAGGDVDSNPTDDMVPPGAESPRVSEDYTGESGGSEDVGPQDYGAEDVGPQDFGAEDVGPQDDTVKDTGKPDPCGVPLPRTGDTGGEESSPPGQSTSDPMPDIAGQGAPE